MPIDDYGVWKANPVHYIVENYQGDPRSPHLTLYFDDRRGSSHHPGHTFIRTGRTRKEIPRLFRAAINIKSGDEQESRLVYWVDYNFHQHPIVNNLTDLSLGFHSLEETEPGPAGLRLDYIRSNLININTGRILPHTKAGPDNDIIDVLEPEIKEAIYEHADVYLFGAKFNTGDGIHDVHINQGNIRRFQNDDGVFQDGGLLINYPRSGRWVGVFLGFASQAVHTNGKSGHAILPETWDDYLNSDNEAIEEWLIKAASNEWRAVEEVDLLLRRGVEGKVTEEVVVAAASNEWKGAEVMELLLNKRGNEVKVTEKVVVAAASNELKGTEVMELLLNKRGNEVKVTEKVVVAAARNELKGTEVIDLLLQRQKDDTAGDEYIWVRDLRSIGYSLQEIADLLSDKARDSPWIYFEPNNIHPYEIQSSRHIPGCAHQCCTTYTHRHTLETLSTEIDAKSVDTRNIVEIVDELCGIGGISPATRTMADWIGSAEFTDENRILAISYTPPTEQNHMHNFQNLSSRILRVLKGFCSAVGVTQANNLCCDSFTVLKFAHNSHESSARDLGEVKIVNFKLVIDLVKALESVPDQVPQQSQFQGILLASRAILRCVSPKLAEAQGESDIEWCLHVCALAVQFLCLGFLSYTQAHIGPLKPFFLETPVQQVILRGLGGFTQFPCLVTELVTLSCLGDMTRGPVLMFRDNEEWVTPDAGKRLEDVEWYNRKARGSSHREDICDLPNVGYLPDWYSDSRFCQQQLTGTNPTTIEWASDRWINHFIQAAKAPEDTAAKKNITNLNKYSRESLYIQDYSYFREAAELDPAAVIKCAFDEPDEKDKGRKGDRYGCASVCLFYLNNEGQVYPLAIVIDWRGSGEKSVTIYNRELMKRKDLRSGDEKYNQKEKAIDEAHDWPWRYAKTCVQCSDWLRHEVTVHLTNTHLIKEATIVASNRQLDPDHPVMRLLYPHWQKTLAINAAARNTVIPHMIIGLIGLQPKEAYTFIRHAYKTFDFKQQYVPSDLSLRGFPPEQLDRPKFHNYAYGRCIYSMWHKIRSYVQDMLNLDYQQPGADEKVLHDKRIQAWSAEMRSPGGADLPSFPTISTFEELVDCVTMCIHIASPQHTAVSYLQNFYQSFVVNKPPCLYTEPPNSLQDLLEYTEKQLVDALPMNHTRDWLLASHTSYLQSFKSGNKESLIVYAASKFRVYQNKTSEKDRAIAKATGKFYTALADSEEEFKGYGQATDDWGTIPYEVLSPKWNQCQF